MSLSIPVVGSRSTARPPGSKDSAPQMLGRTGVKNKEKSFCLEDFLPRNLLAAPATNDRCTNDYMEELKAFLLGFIEEEERCKASPWDWKRIHGEDYEEWQEPLASVHNKFENNNFENDNDEYNDGLSWLEDESDLSDWEGSPTPSATTNSMKPVATWNKSIKTQLSIRDLKDEPFCLAVDHVKSASMVVP